MDTDDDDSVNPLLVNLEDEDANPFSIRQKAARMLSTLMQRFSYATTPPPPVPTTVVISPPEVPSAPSPVTSYGCSCRWGLTVLLLGIVISIVGIMITVSMHNGWTEFRTTGDTLASYWTRYAQLQTRYAVHFYFDPLAAEALDADEVRTSGSTSLSAVEGWVDVHDQRVDWALVVTDDAWLQPSTASPLTFAFWVQSYNRTTHQIEHRPRSPLPLGTSASGTLAKSASQEMPIVTDAELSLFVSTTTHSWIIPLGYHKSLLLYTSFFFSFAHITWRTRRSFSPPLCRSKRMWNPYSRTQQQQQ
jgi:hypothetical protein